MINIMALRQLYKQKKLLKIHWISSQDNPADAITKSNPNKALEKFLDTNCLKIQMEE
jgi:hypothetical protein